MKVLKFSSDRCLPCKALDEFLKSNTPPDIEIISMTRQTHPKEFDMYNIISVPFLIHVDDSTGESIKKWRGMEFMFLLKHNKLNK